MTAPRPTLGYPSMTAAAVALRDQGLSTEQISEQIGATIKNTENLLYYADNKPQRQPRPAEMNGRTVVVPLDVLDSLAGPAKTRGVSVNELARRILCTVADENMVDAVLDDSEETA